MKNQGGLPGSPFLCPKTFHNDKINDKIILDKYFSQSKVADKGESMTARELASKIGVSEGHMSNILAGKRRPSSEEDSKL
jgi:hypothetical protein